MRPTLFEIEFVHGRASVDSYSLFLVLAAVILVFGGAAAASRRGIDFRRAVFCLTLGLVVTAVGARLVHRLTNPDSFDTGPGAIFTLDRTNLSGFAGMILGIPAAAAAARRLRLDVWRLADSVAPVMAASGAVAKTGCFLNGCCFGRPASVPWAVHLNEPQVRASQIVSGAIGLFDPPLPVHPVQLYEVLALLVGGLIALRLLIGRRPDGTAFLVFCLWVALFRLAFDLLFRAPDGSSAPAWTYPAIYSASAAAAAVGLVVRRRQSATKAAVTVAKPSTVPVIAARSDNGV